MMNTNATLTSVAASNSIDSWDTPGAAGAAKWTGEIRGYYLEKVQRVTDGGSVDIFTRRILFIGASEALAIGIDTDDVLTFTTRGQTMTGTARAVITPDIPGVPSGLVATRLELEDA